MTLRSEQSVGDRLVAAIAAQDRDALVACFAPGAQIRALTPKGLRECAGADEIAALISSWYADSTELDLVESQSDDVGDRVRVGYRFEGIELGEAYVVEQQLFGTVVDGKFERADLLCSGFRPRTT